jgi:hypothetical protein
MFLGPSIEPEKPSPKSASSANPPLKVIFIAFSLKFITTHGSGNLSRPITEVLAILFWYLVLSFTLPFIGMDWN